MGFGEGETSGGGKKKYHTREDSTWCLAGQLLLGPSQYLRAHWAYGFLEFIMGRVMLHFFKKTFMCYLCACAIKSINQLVEFIVV